jgi:SPP1 gp7 family putative phage head morphogenesis protein
MTTIRTLEIAFEKQIKNILKDFMSRIDYSNFDDSFDEGLYYFNTLTEQPITKAITTVHNTGYKDANTLIKNRMKTAAVIDKSTTILYIVKKLTDRLHEITENHKEEITEKLVQHQIEQFTYDQIVDDLLTFFDYDTIAASRFARTATNYVYNQAHLQRYKDTGIVPGVRYGAHIDARTSEICRMLNGTIWAVDDPNIIVPPSHFNCRSRILPYYGKIPGERDYTKDFEPEFIEEAENTLKTFKEKYWNM